MRIKASFPQEKGQSMVELAISWVILVMLLAAVVDFGRAFYTYISLRDAAQEGALYGSTFPTQTDEILARVCNSSNFVKSKDCYMGTPDGTESTEAVLVQVSPTGAACMNVDATNGIQVQVTYPNFQLSVPFMGTFLGTDHLIIRAQIIDSILRPPCN